MCELCHQTPCPARCPNADVGMPPYFCDVCGMPLYAGEVAYALEEGVYCGDCVENAVFEVDVR